MEENGFLLSSPYTSLFFVEKWTKSSYSLCDLCFALLSYFCTFFFLFYPPKRWTTVVSSSTLNSVCTNISRCFRLFSSIFLLLFWSFILLCFSLSPTLHCHSHTETPFSILLAFLSEYFHITLLFSSFSKKKVSTFIRWYYDSGLRLCVLWVSEIL